MKINMSRKAAALMAILLCLGVAAKVAADPKKPVPKPTPKPTSGIKGESIDDKHKDTIEVQSMPPAPKPSTPPKSKTLDSHSPLQSMQLRDGANLVQSRDGVKLTAQSRNNSVTGWSATDEAGHELPTKVKERSTPAGPEQVITIQDKAHHREIEMVVTKKDKGAGKISFKPFSITKHVDTSTPR